MTQKSTMPERVGAREPLPLETWLAIQNLLAARDAITDYYDRIPDGCSAEPEYAGRLVRNETKAEEAAREALKG